jgi:soluble lytic murein transglycosylase-like protein
MADAASTAAHGPGLGLRHNGERRSHDRRRRRRGRGDRRFSTRRKRQLGGLLIAAAALATPQQFKARPLQAASRLMKIGGSEAEVQVSIDEFRPLRPEEAYNDLIDEAAAQYDLDGDLIRAVMRAESAFNPHAVSEVGARGLMQLMPARASDRASPIRSTWRQNVMAGAGHSASCSTRIAATSPLSRAITPAPPM